MFFESVVCEMAAILSRPQCVKSFLLCSGIHLTLYLLHSFDKTGCEYFVYAPSQYEMMLHCNLVSHWLGAYTKSFLQWNLSSKTTCQNGSLPDGTMPSRKKPLPEPKLTKFYTPYGVTWPQWVNLNVLLVWLSWPLRRCSDNILVVCIIRSTPYAVLPLFATRFAACIEAFGSLSQNHVSFKLI